jgi:hypothetical protein
MQLYLTKNGVPFDVAFSLDDIARESWYIIFRELDGDVYDWDEERFLTHNEKIEHYKRAGLIED